MAETTKIEWCNATFNPWIGCTKVSEACKFCYAERDMDNRLAKAKWGDAGTRVITSDAYWRGPLQWNKNAECCDTFDCNAGDHSDACPQAVRPRVFCASLADVFEDWRGPMCNSQGLYGHFFFADGEWGFGPSGIETGQYVGGTNVAMLTMQHVRRRLFDLIDATPNLDWLILTKRPENILKFWPARSDYRYVDNAGTLNEYRRDNVWLGTSVENQEQADKRIPELLKCDGLCPVLFLSCEPLLGRVDLTRVAVPYANDTLRKPWDVEGARFNCLTTDEDCFFQSDVHINWVIAGGESGTSARPTHPDWFVSLRNQCKQSNVPFFFKQWGEWSSRIPDDQEIDILQGGVVLQKNQLLLEDRPGFGRVLMTRWGKRAAGRLLDGEEISEFPRV